MQRLTLRVILRTVFGLGEGARMDELERALIRAVRLGARVMLVPLLQRDYGPFSRQHRFDRALAEVDALLLAEIARRRRSGERGDDVCRCSSRRATRTAGHRTTRSCATT